MVTFKRSSCLVRKTTYGLTNPNMYRRILMCLSLAMLTACSTARMERLPGLEADTVSYQLSEIPSSGSGTDLVFGPYKATDLSRSWTRGVISGWNITLIKHRKRERELDYDFQFEGKNIWDVVCKVKRGNEELGIIEGAFYSSLNCFFIPMNSELAEWRLFLEGGLSDRSEGIIKLGGKNVILRSVDKLEGSPVRINRNTGYYFIMEEQVVAAVDVISREGPVWLSESLSQEEKDKIAMIAFALLLCGGAW